MNNKLSKKESSLHAQINQIIELIMQILLLLRSMRCNWKVDPSLEICLNANCPSGTGTEPPEIDQVYDIRVTLLDHTGSLSKCKLTDTVVTKMLGYKVSCHAPVVNCVPHFISVHAINFYSLFFY